MSDQELVELWRRYQRKQAADAAIYTRFNAAERRRDHAAVAACRRRWNALAREEDAIARLAVTTPAESLSGIAFKLAMWRQESAQTGFENPLDLFAFGAYRDAVRLARLPELRHPKDRRELAAARAWTCKLA